MHNPVCKLITLNQNQNYVQPAKNRVIKSNVLLFVYSGGLKLCYDNSNNSIEIIIMGQKSGVGWVGFVERNKKKFPYYYQTKLIHQQVSNSIYYQI